MVFYSNNRLVTFENRFVELLSALGLSLQQCSLRFPHLLRG